MNIIEKYKGKSGVDYIFEYSDADSFDDLNKTKCTQVYAVCFCNGKMVIVLNVHSKTWGLVGGTIEKGESFEETLKREIQEESNMEVVSFLPVGYQKVIDTRNSDVVYQLRYLCTAKPYGEFISDPAGHVTEIKLIDPKDYKQYFDWGEIGERIIRRAEELLVKSV
ncbi:MAG: NUDIX domain-containing protein [Candidatus Paceibacterota bacterium]|jgi:8-oxo-dGTP pyrophosphatase MutT (NUDIX family)